MNREPLKTIPFSNFDDYMNERNKIVQKDSTYSFSSDIQLSSDELMLDTQLSALRKTMTATYLKDSFFPPSRYYYKSKDTIQNNTLYNLVQQMPKGGLMHIHTSSTCDPMWIVDKSMTREDCYICTNESGADLLVNGDTRHYVYGALTFRKEARTSGDFKPAKSGVLTRDAIYKLLTFNVKDNDDSTDIWGEFGNCFSRVSEFICYEPIFEEYYTHAFTTLIEDNIQFVELRAGLGDGLYDLENRSYTSSDMASKLKNAMVTAQKNNKKPDFSVKLIYSGHRSAGTKVIQTEIENAFKLETEFPDFISGYDLVGEEDLVYNNGREKGNTTEYFIKTLMEINPDESSTGKKLPLFFHDGESDWADDTNLYDAVLLDCKRIGHGFDLFRFPELIKLMVEKNQSLEICPLSNQILGYIRDLRIHPAIGYLNEGVQCTISSDDPGIFGYNGVTPDFWEAIMAWELDLQSIKKLIVNSFEFSQFEGRLDDATSKKGIMYSKWEIEWNMFVKNALQELGEHVTTLTIDSTIGYQNTGVTVGHDDQIGIVYESGLWSANPSTGQVTARGNENYPAPEHYPVPTANEGSLVMRIGQDVMPVGEMVIIPQNKEGNLQLVINDDINKHYGSGLDDNTGQIKVSVVKL